MPRVPPTPALVLVDDVWVRGTVRTCDVTPAGDTCTAVVSYGAGDACVTTGRFRADRMRSIDGTPGCPVVHADQSCCG